jgi:CrcB protein
MTFYAFIAIGLGAALGAWLRWGLGLLFNPVLPGLAVAFFMHFPSMAPEWRLFAITGFLGGLTTFSTFSAETVTLLMRGQYVWGTTIIAAHLGGSLLMTVLGMQTFKWIQQ